MIRTGVFTIVNGESRLSDGTLLAICSDPSPLLAARPFLLGRQCQQNHWVEVSGALGSFGGVTAFYMTDARPIAPLDSEEFAKATNLSKPLKPRAARTGAKKTPPMPTKKSPAKQSNRSKKVRTNRTRRLT